MIIGAVAAGITGVTLHLIVPTILGVVAALFISGATLLDPLYAEARVRTTWVTLGTVLGIQVLHTFITAIIVGIGIGYLAARLPSFWLYPVGVLLSLVLHYLLFFGFVAGLSIFSAENNTGLVWGISLITTTIVAPLMGLVSVLAVRWGT